MTGLAALIRLRERFRDEVAVPRLTERLLQRALGAIVATGVSSVLDVGCGAGDTLAYLGSRVGLDRLAGIDADPRAVAAARGRVPGAQVQTGEACALPFRDDAFDLVVCLGLLEHLANPSAALAELTRVSGRLVLVSVPDEPVYRIANLLSGRYPADWGDKPGHRQHWGKRSLAGCLSEFVVLRSVHRCFPWLVALGEKARPGQRARPAAPSSPIPPGPPRAAAEPTG